MIVCCGEALIDMLPRLSKADEPAFSPYSGGAVFNSAIALGRLGVPVEFFSGLSSDLFGEQLRASLAASEVGTGYAHVSGRPTTLAFVHLIDGHATYVFYDEGTAGRMLSEADLPALRDDVDAMLFGAISLIPEPSGSTYEALMKREHGKRLMMFDPNIRPAFIPDREKHLGRMKRMLAMADIVKLSDEDLGWFGEAADARGDHRRLAEDGAEPDSRDARQQGRDGLFPNHTVTVQPQPVTVVDTVGAGDTFNAGILASLHAQGALSKLAVASLSEDAIRSLLDLGARAAAVTVSRAGANPPWKHELG